MLEEEHAEGKCLFDSTVFTVPLEEQWIYDMANSKGRGVLCFTSPSGKVLTFSVELSHFSSTEGEAVPYFEFDLRGATKI